MADPEIKSYEPHHESQSAAVTESRPVRWVAMGIAFTFLAVFLLLPLIVVFHEALSKGIGAYTEAL
ncbi:MAG: sulfate/thiosulfate ABC transporter permease CysW, partial [Mesorhizobium sp.]